MPDITLCTNKGCNLRQHCKRAQTGGDHPQQSYDRFEPRWEYGTDDTGRQVARLQCLYMIPKG